ncbi:hypothetical protein LTR74_000068 [Friedmanniomyces endolithicus]|nr:hypothetical protein LTR74_000068 [Friedmanniomyces endolithicus]
MAALRSANIEASCAICGAPPYPECPHEGERLQLAFDQALARWTGMQLLRDWVLNQSRNTVLSTFSSLRAARHTQHTSYLSSLPCYTLYTRYADSPPLPPAQLATLHAQIQHANTLFQQGVDEDWRRCCLEYPKVLDFYFRMVEVRFPAEVGGEETGGGREQRRVKGRRESVEAGGRGKKERRRSRGRTPPVAPMVVHRRR